MPLTPTFTPTLPTVTFPENKRLERFCREVAVQLSSLVRQSTIRRSGQQSYTLGLTDADIPANITRDTELTAAIAALNLASGVYTPTLTGVANLDAQTAYQCQYLRVGSVVTVSGKVDVDPTAAATLTQLGLSLPIASNIGAAEDVAGTAFASGIAGQGAAILGDAANDRAEMNWISGDVTNQPMYFTFTYRVI